MAYLVRDAMRRTPMRAAFEGARLSRAFASVPGIPWATVDPNTLSEESPFVASNLVKGEWKASKEYLDIVDPMNGEKFIKCPNTTFEELQPFKESLAACPKTGLHNPFKNNQRYLMYGDITFKAAQEMRKPEVVDFFARCIQRVVPKSYKQAVGEVVVSRYFLENFCGDQVRFLARGFTVPGDHPGQQTQGVRFPFGSVGLITPFNFPLEIPVLQLMGALYMGNKVLTKNSSTTSLVPEQFVRLLHHCGMPAPDVDIINCDGPVMEALLKEPAVRTTQFTGSSRTAEHLSRELAGKVKIEDAGFDWKILGPDVQDVNYIAWQCDQDAYACSGQKCSAQSILFAHQNYVAAGLLDKVKALAERRTLDNLTVGPTLTQTTEGMLGHMRALLQIEGASLLWGGKELANHTIPKIYGAIEPTAVFVPLKRILAPENFALCTREVFGPFQVVTEYAEGELDLVLEACERMDHHLTAAIVSNDKVFQHKVLGSTVNGTTYMGARARTTGAPQNHWFGPAGDPRGAGIGTPEAIKLVW
eukprot:CAMPEP_0118953254 /NCGR_PEP_ID=MMETSP1169-20130426/56243_1 /TAXON_ID=36882 /ORGANISM="Pyramimonas obovata, Strain CCMP722" /LENGTH=530 /DNA_ID=CAMNT_0006900669 /DNA_START=114 /DNA_END=1703 /DNA_ORIENTATION=-